jgi:hypothetical protein
VELFAVESALAVGRRWRLAWGSADLGHHSHADPLTDEEAAGVADFVRDIVGSGAGWQVRCTLPTVKATAVSGLSQTAPQLAALLSASAPSVQGGLLRAICAAPVPGATIPAFL